MDKKLNVKAKNLIEDIDDLIDVDFGELQPISYMIDWPLWETRKLSGTTNTKIVHIEKRDSKQGHLRFITQVPPLEEFEHHWHNAGETCTVIGGVMGDKKTGHIWKLNDVAMWSKGEKHKPWNPSAIEPLFILVDFYY